MKSILKFNFLKQLNVLSLGKDNEEILLKYIKKLKKEASCSVGLFKEILSFCSSRLLSKSQC